MLMCVCVCVSVVGVVRDKRRRLHFLFHCPPPHPLTPSTPPLMPFKSSTVNLSV